MSRHRRSRFNALSTELGNNIRERAEQYARAGGRPDEAKATLQQKAAALEPMRNHEAARMGQQHREGLRPGNWPGVRTGGAPNDPERSFQPVDRNKPARATGDRVFRGATRQRLSGTANDHENRGGGPLRGELMSRLVSQRRKSNGRRRLF